MHSQNTHHAKSSARRSRRGQPPSALPAVALSAYPVCGGTFEGLEPNEKLRVCRIARQPVSPKQGDKTHIPQQVTVACTLYEVAVVVPFKTLVSFCTKRQLRDVAKAHGIRLLYPRWSKMFMWSEVEGHRCDASCENAAVPVFRRPWVDTDMDEVMEDRWRIGPVSFEHRVKTGAHCEC